MEPAAQAFPCPFCGAQAQSPRCMTCQRDPRAPRRICAHCKKQTPTNEPKCMHCQVAAGSELGWKVPVIVLMFIVAFIIAIAVQSIK